MNFFRLRFINTLLVLFIGIVLGYVMKERTASKSGRHYVAKYPATYAAQSDAGETPSTVDEPVSAPLVSTGAGEAAWKPVRPRQTEETGGNGFDIPVKLPTTRDINAPTVPEDEPAIDEPEIDETAADEPPEDNGDRVVRGAEDDFFKNPARFAGRDLEMELQMIMARKTAKGWLLNLVRSKGGKNADYLYVEDGDGSVVGDKPDLKIGYAYKARFRCRKGDAASGNDLIRLTPTNEKASWATGVSAVE